MSPSPLVALDANVVMDLGEKSEAVLDAPATIRQRLLSPRIVITPTVALELIHIARHGDSARERKLALTGLTAARGLRIVPVNLMPVGHGIVELVAAKLRSADLLPAAEVNDSQLVAESALLGAELHLSSDEHLRSSDRVAYRRGAEIFPTLTSWQRPRTQRWGRFGLRQHRAPPAFRRSGFIQPSLFSLKDRVKRPCSFDFAAPL